MMTDLKVGTRNACKIVGLNPSRFNEAVHAGIYDCAPRTSRGQTRTFGVDDVIALMVYSHLTNESVDGKRAGPIACELRDFLKTFPDCDRAVQVATVIGSSVWKSIQDLEPGITHMGGLEIVSTREWRLDIFRRHVVSEFEELAKIVG